MRRHYADDHVFIHGLLKKRYQWFTIDKSYRDACRTIWYKDQHRTAWNQQATKSNQTSTKHLPSIHSSENSPTLTMSSFNTWNTNEEENCLLSDEKIKQDFLLKQPVMLEVLGAPHSSQILKHKQTMELRKQSAQKRHAYIQTAAINDSRYRRLVYSLQEA